MTNTELLLYVFVELIVCARVHQHDGLATALEEQRADIYRGLADEDAGFVYLHELLDHDEGSVADRIWELPEPWAERRA